LFQALDEQLIKYYTIERVKSFEETYMCMSGLLSEDEPFEHQIMQVLQFCFDSFQIVSESNEKYGLNHNSKIGISTDEPITIGILGNDLSIFGIFGSSISVASSSADRGVLNHICICNWTYQLISNIQDFEKQLRISISMNEGSVTQSFFVQFLKYH
jgi:hypothetical protein